MFRSTATISPTDRPVAPDWTIQQFLSWIAEDDARTHDVTLRPTLVAIEAATAPAVEPAAERGLAACSPTPLVRAIATRLRATPGLADATLAEVMSGHAAVAAFPLAPQTDAATVGSALVDTSAAGYAAARARPARRQPSVVPS